MSTTINFIVPQGWHELFDKQLMYVYQLLADNFATDEVMILCLLRWNGAKVVARRDAGVFILQKGKALFEVEPVKLAELLPCLDWLGSLPVFPTRPAKLKHRRAVAADFAEVPFEHFIIVDNLYQGYLQTQQDNLLDDIASVVYPGIKTQLAADERIAVFYWVASLKDYFARRYSDFFQPSQSSDGNLLGSTALSVEAAMNAQIRALTKGDITKEREVLALDTHRALTELNAQAREYQELNKQLNNQYRNK